MDRQQAVDLAKRVVVSDGQASCVVGLPEETVAVVFAMFSRTTLPLIDIVAGMFERGELDHELAAGVPSERVKSFHERVTIGYGHKSVADHATVHWALEGVSMVAERDYLSSRLIAATSQSTRFIDYRDVGFVTPSEASGPEVPDWFQEKYSTHCAKLVEEYSSIKDLMVDAVRELEPFSDKWKSEKGWETATEKRALDAVRDILPASVKARFGVSCSATALRELLDKRQTGRESQPAEVGDSAARVRAVCKSALPTLLPEEPRRVPRHPQRTPTSIHRPINQQPSVRILAAPNWTQISDMFRLSTPELISRWCDERGHHLVPDRWSEAAQYVVSIVMPWAIHRDLGRHRMMTQFESRLTNILGYASDPIFTPVSCSRSAKLNEAHQRRFSALFEADLEIDRWRTYGVDWSVAQYGLPMAACVEVQWVLSLRELVHILGLRTTPQGHPSYRFVVQQVAREIMRVDSTVRRLVMEVTNFEPVLVGRPE